MKLNITDVNPFACQSSNRLYTGMMGNRKVLIKELVFRSEEGLNDVVLRAERGEQLAAALKASGLAVISAFPFDGRFVQFISGKPCLIIPWVNGCHLHPRENSRKNCLRVGKLLASVHKLARAVTLDFPLETSEVNYQLDWLDDQRILHNSPVLSDATALRNEFFTRLQQGYPAARDHVLSHRDMNPNNILECDGTLMLLDWEMAGWSTPLDELIDAALEWCHFCQFQTDISLFAGVVEGYGDVAVTRQDLNDAWQRLYSNLLQAVHRCLYDTAELYSIPEAERIGKAEKYILQYYELKKHENEFSSIILKC